MPNIITEPYTSQPLGSPDNAIRLVNIEPELNADGLIVCQLNATVFTKRPRYEALSYRWGDETIKKPILVNGTEIQVATNLWDALDYLRKNPRNTSFWIDAISINQKDIPERNSQVRITPHVYARASQVVVWLGAPFVEAPVNLTGPITNSTPDTELREKVIADGYWDWVWILQEIGKARKIAVLVGQEPCEWERFIEWLNQSVEKASRGPLKLDHLRKDKYDGGCSLIELLTTHADALSKDPRDKIYGLIGLSTDSRGFPIDYEKPLLDVWIDTMRFLNKNDLLPEDDEETAKFGEKLRDILGGDKLGSASGIIQFENTPENYSTTYKTYYDSEDRYDDIGKYGLAFQATPYGMVNCIGPSASELAGSLDLTENWERSLQQQYRKDIDAANRENDRVMDDIFNTPDGHVDAVTTINTHRLDFMTHESRMYLWDVNFDSNGKGDEKGAIIPRDAGWAHQTTTPNEPRLAMLTWVKEQSTFCKLAWVPPQTRLGDLVCCVNNYPMKRIVTRPRKVDAFNVGMYVLGTATLVNDIVPKDHGNHGGKVQVTSGFSPKDAETWGYRTRFYKIRIVLDPRTYYALLFGNDSLSSKMGGMSIK